MNMADFRHQGVSTHMPLARHDSKLFGVYQDDVVSTHMPLARHDAGSYTGSFRIVWFLLTCLLRGMTG